LFVCNTLWDIFTSRHPVLSWRQPGLGTRSAFMRRRSPKVSISNNSTVSNPHPLGSLPRRGGVCGLCGGLVYHKYPFCAGSSHLCCSFLTNLGMFLQQASSAKAGDHWRHTGLDTLSDPWIVAVLRFTQTVPLFCNFPPPETTSQGLWLWLWGGRSSRIHFAVPRSMSSNARSSLSDSPFPEAGFQR
jgi:hypothetical protein